MTLILIFLIGICIGSFLNVVIDRIPNGKSIVYGRSHCDFCKHTLGIFDLFPVVSFIFLRGKCRYCHHSLSLQYPLIELLTGFSLVVLFLLQMPLSTYQFVFFIFNGIFLVTSIGLVVQDMKYHILSDKLLIVLFFVSLLSLIFTPPFGIPVRLVIGLLASLPFFLIFFISKGRAMGFGDVKLSFVLGFFLGFPGIIICLYVAFLTGAVVALILVLQGKKKFYGGNIALGPFLFLGCLIASIYGDFIWKFVRTYFGI